MDLSSLGAVYIIFLYQTTPFLAEKCPESVPTLQYVVNCPENQTEWEVAARRKKCHSIAKIQKCSTADSFVYHCVRTDKGTRLAEVCAPRFYLNGFCTAYDIEEENLKNDEDADCSTFKEPCPTRYLSTESYKYKECYNKVKRNQNLWTYHATDKIHELSNDERSSWLPVVAVLAVCLIVAVVTAMILAWCLIRNKKLQTKQTNTDTAIHEETELNLIRKPSTTEGVKCEKTVSCTQQGLEGQGTSQKMGHNKNTASQKVKVYAEDEIEKYTEEGTGRVIYLRYPRTKTVYEDSKKSAKNYEEIQFIQEMET